MRPHKAVPPHRHPCFAERWESGVNCRFVYGATRGSILTALAANENTRFWRTALLRVGPKWGLGTTLGDIYGILEGESMEELREAFYERARVLDLLWDENGDVLSFEQLEELYAGGNMEVVESNMRRYINRCRDEGEKKGLRKGRREGRQKERQEGLARERKLLCRQAANKFDADTGECLAALLKRIGDPDHLEMVGDWIIDSKTPSELLSRCEALSA